MLRAALIVLLALLPLYQGTILWAQDDESAPSEDIERIIEEILRLRGEAEALLESLPPELREEVERRWKELQTTPSEALVEEVSPPDAVEGGPPEPLPAEEKAPPESIESATEAPTVEETERQLDLEEEPVATSGSAPEPEPEPEPANECDSLGPFDTNGDGVISAFDRNWRYLRLQTGITANVAKSIDLESLYELGIREIDVNLRFYKLADGSSGDITLDDRIRFHLFGKRKADRKTAVLVLQADRLARGDLKLVDASGALLAGDQALAPGMALQTKDGQRLPILCE